MVEKVSGVCIPPSAPLYQLNSNSSAKWRAHKLNSTEPKMQYIWAHACSYKEGWTIMVGEVFLYLQVSACWVTEPFPDNQKKSKTLVTLMGKIINSIKIMAEILSLCKQPQTRTQLMSKTSLSWKMLQAYLSQLQSRQLLEVHHSSTRYATTPAGLKFSERFAEVLEL